ncbi:MAG: site-specific integrase [Oscillospiraceae bacterium]|jgi:integrase|nr:site-specific integrase [Oscillospiraceae bacterium]
MKRRDNGDGTLFKRKDGRWSAQVYVTLANGERKRICITKKDREAVRIKLREVLKQENNRVPYSEKDWTIAEYLDYWMRDIQPHRVRETTMAIYDVMIKNHIKPACGNCKLRSLSTYNVRHMLEVLKENGCSERTRLACLRILSACLNCAVREELIFRNAAQLVEKPKYIPKETTIWTAEQAALFLRTIKEHPQYIAFLLLLTYGMRRGEVLGLRWSDIDFDSGWIHVRQQIGRVNGVIKARELKTGNSRRVLPLMSNVRAALLEHAEKNGVVLSPFNPYFKLSISGTVVASKAGTPLEPRNLTRYYNDLVEKANLPRIKIHAMRHTAATLLKDLNVPVKDAQLILGHSSISTTLNIYQHGTPETHRTAISAVESRLLEHEQLKSDSSFDSNSSKKYRPMPSDNKRITEVEYILCA